MAGGIDWFRWHHGSVTDPKFQLIARKCGVRLGDVIATWAFLLEQASASTDRGSFGDLDFETLDFLLGTDDGVAERIVSAFVQRGMVGGQRIASWEKRQPKRERDPAPVSEDATPPMTPTERSRRHRAKQGNGAPDAAMQRHATPCNASDDHATPREEERREEVNTPPAPSASAQEASIEVFPIVDGWRPSPAFAVQAKLLGLPVLDEQAMAWGLAEFVAFWLARPGEQRTQSEWENALAKSLRRSQVHNAGRASTKPAASAPRIPNHGGHDVVEPA